MQVTIVGLPGSGKTTVFNALTGVQAETGFSMIKRRRQPRLTVTASDDSRFWPNPEADFLEQAPIFLRAATGEENSRASNFLRQLGKNRAQTPGRGESKI